MSLPGSTVLPCCNWPRGFSDDAWLPAALMALMGFGLWGFFSGLAVNHIDARSALVFQTLGVTLTGLIAIALMNFRPAIDARGIGLAILTGVAYGAGCLFYFFAAERQSHNHCHADCALPTNHIIAFMDHPERSDQLPPKHRYFFLAIAAIILMNS